MLLARTAAGFEVPGTGGRVQAGGWVDGLAVAPTMDGPEQRPGAQSALILDAPWGASLSGHLDLRGRVGGPFEGGHQGVYNLCHTFQNYSPALEWNEAYVDARLHDFDVRLGIQKFAWGKLDGVPPTDVVSPRDFHDPFVQDFEERKIGIPALAASYYPPDLPGLGLGQLRATLVYVPWAVPPRLALIEERWFPSSIQPPSTFAVRVGNQVLHVPVTIHTRNDRPPLQLDDGGIAVRLGGTWRASDWSVSHYSGPATGPDLDLRAEAVQIAASPGVGIRTALRQAHDTMSMTGADWSTVLGGATVRVEAALLDDQPFLRLSSDLVRDSLPGPRQTQRLLAQLQRNGRVAIPIDDLFVTRDAVQWGIGADYLVRGFTPLLQVSQTVLLESAPRLIIGDPETQLVGSLRKRWLGERLELELRGTYALERGGWFILPRLSYLVRDDLRVRLGYLAIGGPRTHLFGQFGGNDEVVMQARYSF